MAVTDELRGKIVHFEIEHSYYCGKTRAYLRYKAADVWGPPTLAFEQVLVSVKMRDEGLLPLTGSATMSRKIRRETSSISGACRVFTSRSFIGQ